MLYILCGLPFSGKTTFAKELVNQCGFSFVGLDEINRERGIGLHGKPVSSDDWTKTYNESFNQTKELLLQKKTVIYDATNFTKKQREKLSEIAQSAQTVAKIIFVATPKEECIRRWKVNRNTNGRFDVRDEDFAQVVDNFQKPTTNEHPLLYRNEENMQEWIRKNIF